MTNAPATAIANAAHQSTKGPQFGTGECLMRVRICYDVPALYDDAATAWAHTTKRHVIGDPEKVPAGAVIWWTGGSHGHGHVAISAGNGNCWSTDIKRAGYFDLCRITDIERDWHLVIAGWSGDINNVTVFEEPNVKPKQPIHKPLSRGANIDAAIARLTKARAANANLKTARAKAKLRHIDDALAALHKILAV